MGTLSVERLPDGVARVNMARPNVFNAFDEAMISELDAAFAELGEDSTVRVVVLAGQGKAFSAGADLQWMKRASEATEEWNVGDAQRFAAMLHRIASSPSPPLRACNALRSVAALAWCVPTTWRWPVMVPISE